MREKERDGDADRIQTLTDVSVYERRVNPSQNHEQSLK